MEDLKNCTPDFIDIPFRKFSLKALFKMIHFCRKNGVKIVHSHGRGAGFYSRVMKLFGFKVIHTFHGVHIEKSVSGRVKLILDKILVPLTDRFICVSESEMANAVEHKVTTKLKTIVVCNGVKVPEFSYSTKEGAELVIGTLSRLNYQKGIDILVEYISAFSKNHHIKFKCLIAGDGELREELEKIPRSENIEFLGAVKGDEFLKNIGGYISFARWEGLPIAVIEAMSHALPCLLSRVDGNKDLVCEEEDGLMFNLENYGEFEVKMLSFLSNKALREKIGFNAKRKVISEYSVEKMVRETIKVYSESSLSN